ncbi:MAG: hypothetical protein SV775_00840 [Thermodesulfobacteriota bacterium]|nr:hypothetical protein [Thermodesulfobacteriota bacterium]
MDQYPLNLLDRPIESETCNIIENSYGANLLAFLDERRLFKDIFKITPQPIDINDKRALRVAHQLVRNALRKMGRIFGASQITFLGVSYRKDAGGTPYSGSEILIRNSTEIGAEIKAHGPYVQHWWELEKQNTIRR